MDIDFSSAIILVSLLVFLAMVRRLTTQSKSKDAGCLNIIPGPRRLPLIGNLHQLAIASKPPHRVLTDLAKKYGPVMYLKLGEVNTLVITSPESAKQVMKTHDAVFANRPTLLTSDIVCYKNSDIVFAPYGDYWRQLRKICTLEVLSNRRVQSFQPIRVEEWSKACASIASKEGSPVNLTEKFETTTCETVMRSSLGNTTKDFTQFISIIREGTDLSKGFYIGDLYPSVGLFRAIGGFKGRVERLHKRTDSLLEKIINDHKVATGNEQKREDLVDVLLKFHKEGHDLHLTMDNIKAVILDVFTAGIETSSTTSDWAMAAMLNNPSVLKKAQDEVRRVFSDKGFVDEADFGELHYLKLVIKETLRMYAPVPLLIPRENFEAGEIDGFKIPANTRVMVNAWAIGRDPKYWNDAETFMPERYMDKPVDFKGTNFEYLPFGSGKRICPGMTFGLANVELPLAMLLFHFNWAMPNGTPPDMSENFGITLGRKTPLYAIPKVHIPLPSK